MFSGLSCTPLSCDVPSFVDTHVDEDPLAPLNFDDLLDIAREFEFTRTITHIWPWEEPSTCTETGLEDMFATIVPTPSAEGSPLPLANPIPLMPLEPVPHQEIDWRRSVSMHPASDEPAGISGDPAPPQLAKDDDQVRTEVTYPITAILQGWFPPSGSQFLDLDESLMNPHAAMGASMSPWKAAFVSPLNTQLAPPRNGPLLATIGEVSLQSSRTESKALPVSTVDKADDDPRQNALPFVLLPAQCAILEPARAGSALQANAHVSCQSATHPRARTPKSRVRPSTPTTRGPSTAKYAKAPRGGIPPHIARTVTKANILRVEKERKVMQDAFSSTNVGQGKKPSVLRTAVRTERLYGGSVRKSFDCSADHEKEGRAAKKARA